MSAYSYFDYDQMTLLGIQVHSDELDEDLQESFPFLNEMAETEVVASDRNPK
jgi:hypothetical protein